MLTALVLVGCMAAEPVEPTVAHRSARLLEGKAMTADEAAEAPVSLLTVPELEKEEVRLSDPPSLIHPWVALIGGTVLAAGGTAAIFGVSLTTRPHPGTQTGSFLPTLLEMAFAIVAGTGATMAIVGASTLPWEINRRRLSRERHSVVRARLAAIDLGSPDEPSLSLRAEAVSLASERPGLGLPTLLFVVGTAPLASGIGAYVVVSHDAHPDKSILPLAIGLIVLGLATEGLGIALLINRLQTRAELEEKLQHLEPDDAVPMPPPQVGALPPVPMQFAFSSSF